MVKIKLFSKNAHMHLSKVKGCKRGQNSTGRSKRVFYSDIFLTYKCKIISSKAFHKVILVLVILLYVLIFFKCRYFHCGGLLHSSKLVHLNREARLVFCETISLKDPLVQLLSLRLSAEASFVCSAKKPI